MPSTTYCDIIYDTFLLVILSTIAPTTTVISTWIATFIYPDSGSYYTIVKQLSPLATIISTIILVTVRPPKYPWTMVLMIGLSVFVTIILAFDEPAVFPLLVLLPSWSVFVYGLLRIKGLENEDMGPLGKMAGSVEKIVGWVEEIVPGWVEEQVKGIGRERLGGHPIEDSTPNSEDAEVGLLPPYKEYL